MTDSESERAEPENDKPENDKPEAGEPQYDRPEHGLPEASDDIEDLGVTGDPTDESEGLGVADETSTPATPGTRRRLVGIVGLVVLLALVAAVTMAVMQRNRANDAEAALDERDEIRLVSARFGEAYLSYDFRDVETSGERVIALSTDSFANKFQDERVAEIDALFANIESSTVSRTTAVYLGDVSDTTATALVVVDVEATGAATGTRTLTDLSFVVNLVRSEGSWLVDEVTPPPQTAVAGGEDDEPEESD